MEPIFIAYGSLTILALIPIYIGSFASLEWPNLNKTTSDKETLSFDDAKWFPVIGSATLFSLYLLVKYLDKGYLDMLLTAYFVCLGIAALFKTGCATFETNHPLWTDFHFVFSMKKKVLFDVKFGVGHIVVLMVSLAVGVLYAMTKHWMISNLYGEAFAATAIQLIQLDSFKTGFLLLGGLFFYDIFWVFGTEVMVTVAKSFNAPIKLVFPKNVFALLDTAYLTGSEKDMAMLGLGDIVVPGIFIALCLKLDQFKFLQKYGKKNPELVSFPKPYFIASYFAYIVGLLTTIFVMHTFKAAQPALLYLCPACILAVLMTALIRGEFKQVIGFTVEAIEVKESKSPRKLSSPRKQEKQE